MQEFARNTLLRSVFELAGKYGVRRDDILSEIELERTLADQPGAFIGAEKVVDAVEFAAIAAERDDFGLRLGASQNHRSLGPIGVLIEHCPTVVEAVAEGSRYLHLHNSALVYTLIREREQYALRLQLRGYGKYPPRHYIEACLMMFIRFCQVLMGPEWRPLRVQFEHARMAKRSVYRQYFGIDDISFGQDQNAVIAPRADFEQPVNGANPRLKELIKNLLEDLDRQQREDFSTTVITLLRPLLQSGTASAASVAALLSLKPRTLQRRLALHGTSFNKLLLATRIQLVQDYLTRDDMTVTQMAQVLGFADVSVVSRFLKTHVGRSAKAIKVRSRRPKTRRSGEKRPYA